LGQNTLSDKGEDEKRPSNGPLELLRRNVEKGRKRDSSAWGIPD